MTGLMDRFVAIDPCIVHETGRTYDEYIKNEGLLHHIAGINQVFGPSWLSYKDKACKVMKNQEYCDMMFEPKTLEYEPISILAYL